MRPALETSLVTAGGSSAVWKAVDVRRPWETVSYWAPWNPA